MRVPRGVRILLFVRKFLPYGWTYQASNRFERLQECIVKVWAEPVEKFCMTVYVTRRVKRIVRDRARGRSSHAADYSENNTERADRQAYIFTWRLRPKYDQISILATPGTTVISLIGTWEIAI